MSPSAAARWFVIGAVVGTLFDRFHTAFGVTAYARPILFGQAWFVPVVMGGGAVAMLGLHGLLRRRAGEPADGTTRDVLTATIWFACAYAATGVYDRYRIALSLALYAAFVARALSGTPSSVRWLFSLVTAVGGLAVERAIIALGGFHYLHPGLLGMAAWLPGLYLHTALLVRACERKWPAGSALRD